MINNERLVKTLIELLELDSESGSERPVCDYLKTALAEFTSDIAEDNAGAAIGGDCGNLIANIPGTVNGAPRILLNAHMDVIKPGKGVKPVIKGDLITSSGDTVLGGDDKAGIAVILEALRCIKENSIPHGDLQVIMTVSEEVHLLGARNLDPASLKADFGYTFDCGGPAGYIYTSSPSHDSITARFKGRAAHAGMEPEKGRNAIQIASRAIARMNIGRIDHETTANIGVISGGYATNIVPPRAVIEGEARSHNPEKLAAQIAHMKQCVERAAAEGEVTVEIDVRRHYERYNISEDSPVVLNAVAAAKAMGVEPEIVTSGGGSDANIFNAIGLPVTPVGSAMASCHTSAETVSIETLCGVARFAVELVTAR